jgi:D-tyrosyl-tRNA(Tyr) deacylase
MKTVVQRVCSARVEVSGEVVGTIGTGLVILTGIGRGDSVESIDWMAAKIARLRIFPDNEGKMNRSVHEVGGACLVISQFTLYGDCRKGTRPGFSDAAPPEEARAGFDAFVEALRSHDLPVETGIFQADMQVHLINDGPVTLTLERD